MRNLIEKCDVYDLDRAVIDTLARAGIQPTEAMATFKFGERNPDSYYGPLFEVHNSKTGLISRLIPAYATSNFWDGTTSCPGDSGLIYAEFIAPHENGKLLLENGFIQMAGYFPGYPDLVDDVHKDLEYEREHNHLRQLESRTVDGKVIWLNSSNVEDDMVRQYANLITALYIDESVKALAARDFGEIKF